MGKIRALEAWKYMDRIMGSGGKYILEDNELCSAFTIFNTENVKCDLLNNHGGFHKNVEKGLTWPCCESLGKHSNGGYIVCEGLKNHKGDHWNKCFNKSWKDEKPDDTGMKFDDDKRRYDLLPFYALEKVCEVFTYGAKKYDDNNWRKGIAKSRLFAAVFRHLMEYAQGVVIDPETGLPHLAHAVCTLMMLIEFDSGNAHNSPLQ